MTAKAIRLQGKLFIEMDIEAVTGLHIGGSSTALDIGGLDNIVIRDPLTDKPYIPGSSLRGKMRSLWEKYHGLPQNFEIQKGNVYIHGLPIRQNGGHWERNEKFPENNAQKISEFQADFNDDAVLRIFGLTGDFPVPNPTRLIVQDAFLSARSAAEMENLSIPYTETKWEAVIDRVTSAAVPRQLERVPAGSIFDKGRLIYSVFDKDLTDLDWFFDLFEMLALVEDDYLGGSGSRGSGRVAFKNIRVKRKSKANNWQSVEYPKKNPTDDTKPKTIKDLTTLIESEMTNLREWLG